MNKKLLLVAGGTGGHIFPAIALGKWIKQRKTEWDIVYMSGTREIEKKIYESEKINPLQMDLSGSPVSMRGQFFHRVLQLLKCTFSALKIIREEKISVCVLFGSYVSFPPLLACKMLGIPVFIHEQNAYAGRITRIAAMLGCPILTGWAECSPLKSDQYKYVGIPTRAFSLCDKKEALKELPVNIEGREERIVVIIPGSLGSASLVDRVMPLLQQYIAENLIFIVVGSDNGKSYKNTFFLSQIWNIGLLYSVADLLITRGGASTLAEIKKNEIPTLVVPWQKAVNNHQYKNALRLKNEKNVRVWVESEEDSELTRKVCDLLNHSEISLSNQHKSMYNDSDCACSKLFDAVCSVS